MYAVLNSENTVIDLELRDLPLSKLIHPNFQHLYVDIGGNEQGIDKKWIYSPQSKKFSKPIKEYFFFNDSNICLEIMLMCGKEAKPRQRQPRLPLYRIRMEQ